MSTDDENYDKNRHDSARGWSDSKIKKAREDYRRKHPEENCHHGALDTMQANEWFEGAEKPKKNSELLGDLWRPGEVAVLFGETSVGKSVLAVQIAQAIADGRGMAPFSRPRRRRVLYLDLQSSNAQFRERYSCPSKKPGAPPVRHRFPPRLERTAFGDDLRVPESFNGDMPRYLRHSINLAFRNSEADVYIIDGLSNLEASGRGGSALSWMRAFRLTAAEKGSSFLVLAPARPRGGLNTTTCLAAAPARSYLHGNVARPILLSDVGLRIADIADSVFALSYSTFGPDFRYLKLLKSKNTDALMANADDNSHLTALQIGVLTYRLERMAKPPASSAEVIPQSPENSFPHESSTPAAPKQAPKPFLGLTYLGPATESVHLKDYAADVRRLERQLNPPPRREAAPRSRIGHLAEAVINGDYQKYILGP